MSVIRKPAKVSKRKVVNLPRYSFKGVQYVFLDTPVRLLEEVKCPVCLELLSEPVVTSCEHLFCRNCIKGQQTCPTCREEFTTTPDVGSTKLMKAFKVKCPNSVWCGWQGDLGDAEEHLEINCLYQKVECSNGCGEKIKRNDILVHIEFACPFRSCECPHCGFKGVYQDVTSVHYANCRDIPLPCPAECGRTLARKDMENHLSTECPDEYISCEYNMFGCDTAVRRREKDSHFSDDAFHLKNVMTSQLAMFHVFSKCLQAKSLEFADTTSLPLSFRPWLQNTPTCYPRPPWVVKLEGFDEKKKNSKEWHSEPIYSHFGGYKMCLNIDANGYASGKGSFMSLSIRLMKGDNDDNLKFPFKGHIVVSLLNQLENKKHHTTDPWTPESNVPTTSSGRVTKGEISENAWGYPLFIPHKDLYNSDNDCQYLKNDCLFFRISKIEPNYQL